MSRWFCIPPASFLPLLANWQTHMIIGPHVLHNLEYKHFYVDHPEIYTMLDNGLWEGEVLSDEVLLEMAIELQANEIIAPDDASADLTIQKTTQFMDYIKGNGLRNRFKIHGVIHGNTYGEHKACYDAFVNLGVDVIALPKMLGAQNRAFWMGEIKTQTPHIPVHFLGFYLNELDYLAYGGFIRSFDTSMPFKPNYNAKFNLELPNNWINRTIIKHRLRSWKKRYRK